MFSGHVNIDSRLAVMCRKRPEMGACCANAGSQLLVANFGVVFSFGKHVGPINQSVQLGVS